MFVWLEYIGIAAFAVSGVMAGLGKRPDLIGALILAFVTALGGGVVRDAILGHGAVTFREPVNFYIIVGAAVLAMILPRKIARHGRALLFADAVGLGTFNASGLLLAVEAGVPLSFAAVLGAVTGCGGGMIRDVLIGEIPLILRREIYVSACLAGSIAGFFLLKMEAGTVKVAFTASAVTTIIRLLALRFGWYIPQLRGSGDTDLDK